MKSLPMAQASVLASLAVGSYYFLVCSAGFCCVGAGFCWLGCAGDAKGSINTGLITWLGKLKLYYCGGGISKGLKS